MPSEKGQWTALRPHMAKAGLDPIRVENRALKGTPDVNYIYGWLELKHADRWPPKGGPLQLKHAPTPEQRVFLLRREGLGGRAFLCLRVGKEWFLINGWVAHEMWGVGRLPPDRKEIEERCFYRAKTPKEIAERLREIR
jgi:hypothetical protein